MLKLNLGCSNDLKAGWMNVDIAPPADDPTLERPFEFTSWDLNDPWPWEDSSAEVIYAHDVFEHITDCQHVGAQICKVCYGHVNSMPARRRGRASGCDTCGMSPCDCTLRAHRGKVHAMNEAWRVLKPGGVLDLTVPSVSLINGNVNESAFADPTHASYWTMDDQFYFSEQFNHQQVRGTFRGAPEEGERWRMGAAYGITAVFAFPELDQIEDRTWTPTGRVRSDGLLWRKFPMAGGARAKIVGLLRAVK